MGSLGNKAIMTKNIRFYMERDRRTRADVCKALDVAYTTFTDWVNGNAYPRIDKIEAMAHYFGVTKADLVEEKPLTVSDEGLSEVTSIFERLSPDNRAKLLELSRLFLDAQNKSEGKK